jgi:hypothetical protein
MLKKEEINMNTEEIKKEEVQEEEDDSLPFPRARVVNIIKKEIGPNKQIRSEVKSAVNAWLGDVLKKVAREMGKTQFGSVSLADFQRATKPYDMLRDILKDEQRLHVATEKLTLDAEAINRELKHFFHAVKGTEEEDEQ